MMFQRKYIVSIFIIMMLSINVNAMHLAKEEKKESMLQSKWVKYGCIGSAVAAIGTLAYYWYRTSQKKKESFFLDKVKNDNVSEVKRLLENGYKMNLSPNNKDNPLYYVAEHGSSDMMNTLLEHSDCRDPVVTYAFRKALWKSNISTAKILLHRGVSLKGEEFFLFNYFKSDDFKQSKKAKDIIKLLDDYKFDFCQVKENESYLGHVVPYVGLDQVATWLDDGKMIDEQSRVNAVSNALKLGNVDVAEVFFKKDAFLIDKLNWNKLNLTFFRFFGSNVFYEAVRCLHKYGFNFAQQDDNGNTLLHLCVKSLVNCEYSEHTCEYRKKPCRAHSCGIFFILQEIKKQDDELVMTLLLCIKANELKVVPKFLMFKIMEPIWFFSKTLISIKNNSNKTAYDILFMNIKREIFHKKHSFGHLSHCKYLPLLFAFHDKQDVEKVGNFIKPD